jgi:hypothetical protein
MAMGDERRNDERGQLWRLQEVADAARELPIQVQTERLRAALGRLVERPSFHLARPPEDPPGRR